MPQLWTFTACSACLEVTQDARSWEKFDLSQHAHFQISDTLSGIFRCSTCITLSSIVSICAGAPRARTVQLLNDMTLALRLTSHILLPKRQLCSPGFSGTRRQLAQHCRLLVLHRLDTINFKHARVLLTGHIPHCLVLRSPPCNHQLLREWVCAVSEGSVVTLVRSIFPSDIAHDPMWTRVLARDPPSHEASSLDARRGSPSVFVSSLPLSYSR